MSIEIKNLVCGYGKKTILNDVSFSVSPEDSLCLLGANGIGKTTIFKSLLGFIPPLGGEILIDGQNLNKMSHKERAMKMAYVPQAKSYSYKYTVSDMIMMGRSLHIPKFMSPSKKDYEAVEMVMEQMDLLGYRDAYYSELSGGEQQIILIARAIAQGSDYIIMDEPASNLDYSNQKKLLDTILNLTKNNKGILMASHTPEHAFVCCNKALLITRGREYQFGTVNEIVTSENLSAAYGVDIEVIELDSGKKTCCLI